MLSAIRYVLIVATLALCAVATLALGMERPREQAVLRAVFYVLVGMVFGALLVLGTLERLMGISW